MTADIKALGVVYIKDNGYVGVRTVFVAKNNGVEWTQEGMSWEVGQRQDSAAMKLAARLAAAVTAGVVWTDLQVKGGPRPDDPPRITASNKSVYGKYLDVSLRKLGY